MRKRCDFKNDSHRRQRCFNCRNNGVAMARQLQRLLLQHLNTRACQPLKAFDQAAQARVFPSLDCQPLLHRWSDLRYAAQHRRIPRLLATTGPSPTPPIVCARTRRFGCTAASPVAKWVGVYRSVQRPHPIAPQAAVFEYMDKWHKRMFFIRDHNHVVVVFDGRVNPLKRRERTQTDIAKTAAAEQTLQDAVNARADDEKYCDYRQEDWAAFRSRVDAAQLCVARYDNLLSTTFKERWLPAGVLCWAGASLAGRCFVAGGYCVGMLVRVS